MSEEREPVEVWPLTHFLCEEMQARGWTTADVAIRMKTSDGYGIDKLTLDLLMANEEANLIIDDNTFAALARAFGVSEQYFRNLHAVWKNWPDRRVAFECPESIFGEDA
jgi:hypothetical protein